MDCIVLTQQRSLGTSFSELAYASCMDPGDAPRARRPFSRVQNCSMEVILLLFADDEKLVVCTVFIKGECFIKWVGVCKLI